MRNSIGLLAFCFLAGCASSPPKPPEVKGEYRPVNKIEVVKKVEPVVKEEVKAAPVAPAIPGTFDFQYEGDIINSLGALRTIQPQLNILPTTGEVTPLPVRVDLHNTTLEGALKALGDQGGKVADVILRSTHGKISNDVLIHFNTPVKKQQSNPSEVKGTFSVTKAPAIPGTFDFSYEGDIVNSLDALRAFQPQLKIMPVIGKPTPVPVRVELHGVTLKDALKALGEQGGKVADVLWNPVPAEGGDQATIRFNSPNKQP